MAPEECIGRPVCVRRGGGLLLKCLHRYGLSSGYCMGTHGLGPLVLHVPDSNWHIRKRKVMSCAALCYVLGCTMQRNLIISVNILPCVWGITWLLCYVFLCVYTTSCGCDNILILSLSHSLSLSLSLSSPYTDKQQQPWRLHYGVKFFIPDPAKLKDDQSR